MIKIGQVQIEIRTIQPLHQTPDGWIISANGREDNEDQVMLQPRLLFSRAGSVRGNHYHEIETEWIVFLNGIWKAEFWEPGSEQKEIVELDCNDLPMLVIVPPKVAHVFINTSEHTAYIFHFSDQPYTMNRSKSIIP